MPSMTSSSPTGTDISLLCEACQDGNSNRVRRHLGKLFGDNVNQRSGEFLHSLMYTLWYATHIARLRVREGADATLKD